MSTVCFATTCWEKDWREILLSPDYLRVQQIERHCYPFHERLLIINNVQHLDAVRHAAEFHLAEKTLTRVIVADEVAPEVLASFQLTKDDFPSPWVYYNALAPLTALWATRSSHLLYVTGDVRLTKPVRWIYKALRALSGPIKVANLTWNDNYKEVRREAYRRSWNFYVAKEGFSDQMFLVRKEDFAQPIYKEIREDSRHYPRGPVFEARAFSAMKTRGWERVTYRWGSYLHQNFT
jgi:hypothetical protein